MHYISHPNNGIKKGSRLVPFCYAGKDTKGFDIKVELGEKNLSRSYDFCTMSKQQITDLGICTTIQFKKVVKMLFATLNI